jgi:hypothetical protein
MNDPHLNKRSRANLNVAVCLALSLFFPCYYYFSKTILLWRLQQSVARLGVTSQIDLYLWCLWCGVVALISSAVAVERPDARDRRLWFIDLAIVTTVTVLCVAALSFISNALYSPPPDPETNGFIEAIFMVFLIAGLIVSVGMAGAVFLVAKLFTKHRRPD